MMNKISVLFCAVFAVFVFCAEDTKFPHETVLENSGGSTMKIMAGQGEREKEEKEGVPKCARRRFGDSFVCVCNSTHCDRPEEIGPLSEEKAVVFQTDRVAQRLQRKELRIWRKSARTGSSSASSKNTASEFDEQHQGMDSVVRIRVNASLQFQKVHGFGGAFTDAAGFNLNTLSDRTRMQLLRTYFDKQIGIRYTIGRVPIASCDFSTRVYSYCDTEGDFQLKTFALTKEDLEMKIPHMRTAKLLSGDSSNIRFFASPWSAPAWMKTSGRMAGGGSLRGTLDGPYYLSYAHYFRRFFEEYALLGNITFWGVTVENEPQYGLDPGYLFQAMWISPEMQRNFADRLLAPILKQSPAARDVLIMAHDDDRSIILNAAKKIFGTANRVSTGGISNKKSRLSKTKSLTTKTAVAGLAYHWYSFCEHSVLSQIHELYPDKFLFGTEACAGWTGPLSERGPSLGNWTRAMMYGRDILRGLSNWATGWTDWNLCLDTRGGPNWVNNVVDSPILVNSTADEFYKQPMFYAMAHFSRFIPPGSVRIDSQVRSESGSQNLLELVAFRVPPDGNRVLVLVSSAEQPLKAIVEEVEGGGGRKGGKGGEKREGGSTRRTLNVLSIPPNSISTIVWAKAS